MSNLMNLPKSQRTPKRIVLRPKNQKPKLLSVPITLRFLRKFKRRKRITAGTKGVIKPHKMEDHKKALPQPPRSTTPPSLKVEIYERTRIEAEDRTQPRLPAGIATKRATMPTSVQNLQSQKTSIGLGDLRVGDWW